MPKIFSARVIFYLLILVALDLNIAPIFRLGPLQFVLTYLMVLYAAFQWGWQRTIPMAFVVGMFRDFFSSQALGVETVSLVLAALLLDQMVQKMQRELLWLRMVTGVIFILSILFFQFLITGLVTGVSQSYWYSWGIAFGSALYSAVLIPLFFFISAHWFHDRMAFKQYELFAS